MKALTIKEPYAKLITQGDKKYEFRSWKTKFRGELLIHAGKTTDKDSVEKMKKYILGELPNGKILGKVTIVDCIEITKKFQEEIIKENIDIYGKAKIGEYAWILENPITFDKPIEISGKLGLWNHDM